MTARRTLPPLPPPMIDAAKPEAAKPEQPVKLKRRSGKRRKVASERFQKLNRFVDVTMRDLSLSESLVWKVLYRDERNGCVENASQRSIAVRTGMRQATVAQAVKKLTERGLLEVVRQGAFRRGTSTYKIHSGVSDAK